MDQCNIGNLTVETYLTEENDHVAFTGYFRKDSACIKKFQLQQCCNFSSPETSNLFERIEELEEKTLAYGIEGPDIWS